MKHLPRLTIVCLALLLAGCATSADKLQAPPPAPPNIPAVPADVMACAKEPTDLPDRDLTDGEVERLWKTDRAALVKVSSCLRRAVCQALEVRRDIGGAQDQVVCAEANKPAPARARSKLRKRGAS